MSPKKPVPHIKGWAPLELAETQLFPGVHPHQLTKAQRDEALALAKRMLAERTGHVMEP
jgi:hypothetical protein